MIKIVNNIIPVKGYKAMAIWPFLFVRNGARFDEDDERHEKIHGRQQKELILILFYLLYFIFWVVGVLRYNNCKMAYRNNPFELEAYTYQDDTYYLSRRKHYAWVKYIGKTLYNI